jgi:hypothetical protein
MAKRSSASHCCTAVNFTTKIVKSSNSQQKAGHVIAEDERYNLPLVIAAMVTPGQCRRRRHERPSYPFSGSLLSCCLRRDLYIF